MSQSPGQHFPVSPQSQLQTADTVLPASGPSTWPSAIRGHRGRVVWGSSAVSRPRQAAGWRAGAPLRERHSLWAGRLLWLGGLGEHVSDWQQWWEGSMELHARGTQGSESLPSRKFQEAFPVKQQAQPWMRDASRDRWMWSPRTHSWYWSCGPGDSGDPRSQWTPLLTHRPHAGTRRSRGKSHCQWQGIHSAHHRRANKKLQRKHFRPMHWQNLANGHHSDTSSARTKR